MVVAIVMIGETDLLCMESGCNLLAVREDDGSRKVKRNENETDLVFVGNECKVSARSEINQVRKKVEGQRRIHYLWIIKLNKA